MTEKQKAKTASLRKKRLEQALRANLRKRKIQNSARKSSQTPQKD